MLLFLKGFLTLKFLLIFVFSAAEENVEEKEYEFDGDVLLLNEKNFEEIIKKNNYIFVDIYSPGCEWCKTLEPRYAKVATQLKKEKSVIKIAKVNDLKYPKVGATFNVQNYPTLIFFYNGIRIIYDDKFTEVAMIRWLKKRMTFLPKEIKSIQEVDDLIISADVVVIGYFTKNNTAAITNFYQMTTSFDDVPFGIIHDKIIAQNANITQEGIVYFEKFVKNCSNYNETEADVAGTMKVWNRKCLK